MHKGIGMAENHMAKRILNFFFNIRRNIGKLQPNLIWDSKIVCNKGTKIEFITLIYIELTPF
ncbi:hypothetical protein GCM10011339_22150 [Echinicola rosea]|uniref:Uncharacterized protein n=1 Tax=Echinicola rosea TaxID=1807691 RepID=A0ABQ1V336_9BACT|nr:hypothetical protein GCM10011339_22150 [Echinicola rosea]